jgi:hypothetical protein
MNKFMSLEAFSSKPSAQSESVSKTISAGWSSPSAAKKSARSLGS